MTTAQAASRYEEQVDRGLLEATKKAMSDPDNQEDIPWEQVKAELGL